MSTLSQRLIELNNEALHVIKAALEAAGGRLTFTEKDNITLYFDTMFTDNQEFYLSAITANKHDLAILVTEADHDDPVVETHELLELSSDKLFVIADYLLELNKPVFIDDSLIEDYEAGLFNYATLGYTIEEDPHTHIWQLTIVSTSLSELDGSDEGVIGEYIYNTEDEAKADLNKLDELTICQFDEI